MDKAVICIGGSELQLPILQWARVAGLRTLLTDQNPGAPGRAFADVFAPIAGDDQDALVDFALEQSKTFEIVSAYSGSDYGLESVARVNRALGLDGLNPEAVRTSLNKAEANARLRDAGLPVPDGHVIDPGESIDADQQNYPVIVKPVDGSGSRGVTLVAARAELLSAVESARNVSPSILVEQVIEGTHQDISGFFADGAFYEGGQLDRYFSPPPDRYPIWGVQPPECSEAEQRENYALLESAARVLGLEWGPVKADLIRDQNGPVIIEVTPRFHGDVSTSFVCPLAHGVSPVQHWMDFLASGKTPAKSGSLPPVRNAAWAGIFPDTPGVVQAIDGVEDALTQPGVMSVLLRRGPGWKVERLGDNRAVIGFLFATGESVRELEERLKTALAKIRVSMAN